MIRTYLDAGVLIAAVRGQPAPAHSAYELLEDPEREFVASVFLRLEVLPKAIYQRRTAEVEFYRWYFALVVAWANPVDELVSLAERDGARYGLSALDALHVTAASMLGADELVTTEGLRKSIHRATSVRVVAIR
ncbi:MAG: type II toxin-antitoxin system VapC family toxin [Gammaproteobacteria bacterium]